MKRLFITTVSVLAIGLAGCGSDAQKPTNVPEPTAPIEQPAATNGSMENDTSQETDTATDTSTDTSTDRMKEDMDKLSFKEIEVDVSYGKDREYEAEIEQDRNEPYKAKVEDEVNDVYLRGQEAFDDLYPKIQQLTLTKDSTKEEVIDQILNAFNLDRAYEKFEVEIQFHDGSKLDVEDRK